MRYLLVLFFVPMLCLGQSNKIEINKLIKSLNEKLVSKNQSTEEKFTFSVNDAGLLQIERTITAPKVSTRKFTYSLYLKDTEYFLDSQRHDSTTLYAFVFKDKMVKKNIKQVLKVKNNNSSQSESTETDSFVTLIIPVTIAIEEEDIKFCSEAINKIFELAEHENSYLYSNRH